MPSGTARGIGQGLAKGVNSFLNSFYQAKQFEMQEKREKNSVILSIMMEKLKDDDIPLYERSEILRAIPNLYGIKSDAMDSILNMADKTNKQLVDDPNLPAIKGKAGTQGEIIGGDETLVGATKGDEEAGEVSTGASTSSPLQLRDTQATEDVAAGKTERGNLTPNQIKMKLVLAQNAANDEQDIEKQTKILTLNYNLQKNILGKGGYTEKLPYTFDEDKNLIVRFMRPSDGEIISKNLGKVTTEALEKANISAGTPKGRFGAIQEANQIVDAAAKDPTAYPEWKVKAAQTLLDELEKTGQVKDAQITALRQGITGTRPPTLTAVGVDADRDRTATLQVQKDIDDYSAEASAAQEEVKRLGEAKTAAALEASKIDKQIADNGYEPGENEYKDLMKQKLAHTQRYNQLEEDYNKALRNETLAKTKLGGAKGRLNSVSTGAQGGKDPKVKAAIDLVRKNNPDKTATMSDEDIILYLQRAGKIK